MVSSCSPDNKQFLVLSSIFGESTILEIVAECKMVCHGKCALSVSITCEADQQLRSHTLTDSALSFYKTIVQETKDEVIASSKHFLCDIVLN